MSQGIGFTATHISKHHLCGPYITGCEELTQASKQTHVLGTHLNDLKDAVHDLTRREAHYRRKFMDVEAENAELRVTVSNPCLIAWFHLL